MSFLLMVISFFDGVGAGQMTAALVLEREFGRLNHDYGPRSWRIWRIGRVRLRSPRDAWRSRGGRLSACAPSPRDVTGPATELCLPKPYASSALAVRLAVSGLGRSFGPQGQLPTPYAFSGAEGVKPSSSRAPATCGSFP